MHGTQKNIWLKTHDWGELLDSRGEPITIIPLSGYSIILTSLPIQISTALIREVSFSSRWCLMQKLTIGKNIECVTVVLNPK